MTGPQRIVCLTEETVETMYLLGQEHRMAGGRDCFAHLRTEQAAQNRIVTSDQVIAAQSDIIIGSLCGKTLRPEKIDTRPGWHSIPAVAQNRIAEIKSPFILQPGPAALTDGLDALIAAVNLKKDRA